MTKLCRSHASLSPKRNIMKSIYEDAPRGVYTVGRLINVALFPLVTKYAFHKINSSILKRVDYVSDFSVSIR